jgi:ferredoxin
MFQIIHAVHLAGRCTGCGECQRACPAGIPVLLLKRTLSRGVTELFDYDAGMDQDATPPLLTFQVEEAKIKEREW